MNIGQYNDLEILRFTSVGAYLADEENNEVLLPNKYLTDDLEIGDKICIFLYKDSEDRPVATTEDPFVTVDGFAFLTIKSVDFYGAFADWGLEKDLLIPFKEQRGKLEEDKRYLVHVFLDEATNRLVGTTKINKFLQECQEEIDVNEKVKILICEETDLGFKVIVDDKYNGLIFHSNVTKSIRVGDRTLGYVQKVREDGKLDILLNPEGYVKIEGFSEQLLSYLKENKKLPLTEKSHPDDIREHFGMSKKSFKQAIGNLYKEKLITINKEDYSVSLIEN